MHILRNIPKSTLGYFCGEALISINEMKLHISEFVVCATEENETIFADRKSGRNNDSKRCLYLLNALKRL